MGIKTDSTPLEAPKDPDQCTVFALYQLMASPDQTEQLRQRYLNGGMGSHIAGHFQMLQLVFSYRNDVGIVQ